jgi:transposase InsO family protein
MAGERTAHIATGMRGSRAGRQEPASLSLRESASLPSGELHPEPGARALHLGGPQDSRAPAPQILRDPHPGQETVHAVLDRHGTGQAPRSRASACAGNSLLSSGQRPNELWCADYKGEFLLGNHAYCYPLTVTDHASRYLLTCEALSSLKEDYAFAGFERLFKERGLPAHLRSDNGVPFASARSLFN